jgi:predicted transcriptional regulator
VVSLSAVEKVPQERREVTTVAQVMTPADKLSSVSPNDNGITVLERMEEQGIGLIPVVWEGMVVGVIGREELRHFIRIRTDYR